MKERLAQSSDHAFRPLRLGTLNRLRWVSLSGQFVALLYVGLVLGFPVPVWPCAVLVLFSVCLTVFLQLRYPPSLGLRTVPAMLLLAYDALQLAALLFFTGGLQNPFALIFIVPVMTSAIALPLGATVLMASLVLILSGVIAVFHWPLPWYPGETFILPQLYNVAVWFGLAVCVVYATICAWRVTLDERRMHDAMASADVGLARGQQLVALDGMAAAAAHALGTPLSTIAVAARELERRLPEDDAMAPEIEVLKTETDRCREILSRISLLRAGKDEIYESVPISQFLEEIVEPFRSMGPMILTRSAADRDGGGEPQILRSPAIRYGLGNLVENAVEFAASTVDLRAMSTVREIEILVEDDGPGFSSDVFARLGHPYVTDRRGARPVGSRQDGLGLGVFIAKTLLERTGARIAFQNRREPEKGAAIHLIWPREALEFVGRGGKQSNFSGHRNPPVGQ